MSTLSTLISKARTNLEVLPEGDLLDSVQDTGGHDVALDVVLLEGEDAFLGVEHESGLGTVLALLVIALSPRQLYVLRTVTGGEELTSTLGGSLTSSFFSSSFFSSPSTFSSPSPSASSSGSSSPFFPFPFDLLWFLSLSLPLLLLLLALGSSSSSSSFFSSSSAGFSSFFS